MAYGKHQRAKAPAILRAPALAPTSLHTSRFLLALAGRRHRAETRTTPPPPPLAAALRRCSRSRPPSYCLRRAVDCISHAAILFATLPCSVLGADTGSPHTSPPTRTHGSMGADLTGGEAGHLHDRPPTHAAPLCRPPFAGAACRPPNRWRARPPALIASPHWGRNVDCVLSIHARHRCPPRQHAPLPPLDGAGGVAAPGAPALNPCHGRGSRSTTPHCRAL
mmetsp:Transcript_18857/g.46942  ORF Transcript_18857/g.46942 Transcript_18857/m.46942 type:complete len:222 (+) Transcript_18857:132-797(+)